MAKVTAASSGRMEHYLAEAGAEEEGGRGGKRRGSPQVGGMGG